MTLSQKSQEKPEAGLAFVLQLEAHLEHRTLKHGSYMIGGQKGNQGCFSEEGIGGAHSDVNGHCLPTSTCTDAVHTSLASGIPGLQVGY